MRMMTGGTPVYGNLHVNHGLLDFLWRGLTWIDLNDLGTWNSRIRNGVWSTASPGFLHVRLVISGRTLGFVWICSITQLISGPRQWRLRKSPWLGRGNWPQKPWAMLWKQTVHQTALLMVIYVGIICLFRETYWRTDYVGNVVLMGGSTLVLSAYQCWQYQSSFPSSRCWILFFRNRQFSIFSIYTWLRHIKAMWHVVLANCSSISVPAQDSSLVTHEKRNA